MSYQSEPINRAERNAEQDWFLTAERCLRLVARQKQSFTADDVWEQLREFRVETKDNRAMGAVFQNAYRDHLIVPINQWQASRRRVAHRRPVRVWKSLLM